MSQHRFPTDGTPRLVVRVPLGALRVVSGASDEVAVELSGSANVVDRFSVEQRGGIIHVEPATGARRGWSRVEVTVACSTAIDLSVRLASADLRCDVTMERLVADTASGDVFIGDILGDLEMRSASGDIRVGRVGGRALVSAASGDIRVAAAASAQLKSLSGDVFLGEVAGDASVRSAAGDLRVGSFAGKRLEAKTMAGDVSVGLVGGRRYEVALSSLSGEIRTDYPVQDSTDATVATIEVKTVSGDITLGAATLV